MNQEVYIINPGERELKSFIEDSLSTLNDIEERLSFKKASDSTYLEELGYNYRVLNVQYLDKKPIDADIKPTKLRVKDIKKAHETINRELDNFDIYVTASISGMKGILGKLAIFGEYEQRYFSTKFFFDKRKDAEILEEAVKDFLPKFKKRFRDLTLNGAPLVQTVENEIREGIVDHKKTVVDLFRKEIEGDIVKDLFRYIIIYAKTLKKITKVIKDLIEQPGAVIQGEPWNPKKAVIKEAVQEELEMVQKDPLSFYRERLESVTKEAAEESRNKALRAIDTQRETAITKIEEQRSSLEMQLTQHQTTLVRAMEDRSRELETIIAKQKDDAVNTIQKYQQQANNSIEEQKQRSIQDLHKMTKGSMYELQQAKDTVVRQFEEELRKRIIDISHRLEHLDRREYEIAEKLRETSQYIQDHPTLNTSVIDYWRTLMKYAFTLHTSAEDKVIPESAKVVWLNGINQTLGALLAVRNDRLAERAMREGSKYTKIPTTEADCQRIWDRFAAYIDNPQSEDMGYLRRRMNVYATDKTLKNVAIPATLYKEGLVEFDRNYRSIDPEKDKGYEARKHYFKMFFIIAYDEMVVRFRELILNMVV